MAGAVEEDVGVWEVAGEEPCLGEGACRAEAVCLFSLKCAQLFEYDE
jgi:hypothetical protein